MATTTRPQITVDEYLHSSYSPDRDYVDGELQERNVGELDHAEVQTALTTWFRNHDKEWSIRTVVELRIRVSPTRFRIADICLISRNAPVEQVPQHPPLAIIEVLSPEDRVSRYQQRLDDYRQMGIRHIWVVDPQTRRGYDCSTGSWIETNSLAVENSPIAVDLSVIFADLD
ncbi:MAG: Uma2 family endonuclease [Candidatus Korobacteraceae bacterium]